MTNIKISLVAPSIRPHLWEKFCNSLANNDIEWEAIFVGPLPPLGKLPDNFRWIQSSVKPSQCTHIGFLEAKGELISLTADDAIYFTPDGNGALDNMYNFVKNFPSSSQYIREKITYGFRMFEDSFCIETTQTHYLAENGKKVGPLLFPFFVMHKDLYNEMKGYDTRFICGQAETDLQLRITAKYGNTESSVCPTAMVWANHDEGHQNKGKFREYHAKECKYIKDMWIKDYSIVIRPEILWQLYNNDDSIYTISQGNKGEWD